MKSVTVLLCIILAAYCAVAPNQSPQTTSHICQKYYIYTKQKGCIKSCSHPDFSKCPSIYLTIWLPRFCALSQQGVWQSFTYACQACMATSVNFIGVADGKCQDNTTVTPPIQQPKCKQHQIYTKQRGCIMSCSDPVWKTCGNIFPAIYAPRYCALGKDGQWKSFTFSCQACPNTYPNTQYLGIDNGTCEGTIEPPPPTQNVTPIGRCNMYEIYTKERGCISSCADPKWKQCSDFFIDIYNPRYCALGKDGKWKSFTFACQACPNSYPNTEYVGVADGECGGQNTIPIPPTCKQYQVYTQRRGCISACSDPKWKQCGDYFPTIYDPKFCALGKDGKWKSVTFACQACTNDYPNVSYVGVDDGICQQDIYPGPIDKCVYTTCPTGTRCLRGECLKIEPVDKCSLVLCRDGTKCQDGVCVVIDKCATVRCRQGTRCVNGNCVNIPPPVDNCALVLCQTGTKCVNGKCIPDPSQNDTNQPNCSLILCQVGYKCVYGKCVIDNPNNNSCALILCQNGTKCVDGKCVAIVTPPPTQIYACPQNAKYSAKKCIEPRPDNSTCPVIYYFVPPPPLFCGIKSDGSRVNFARQCQACKQKSIVYYFDRPCHKAPFVCQKQTDCNGQYCTNVKCNNTFECPYDWQGCVSGTCQDRCVYMRCAGCKYGQCGYQEPSGSCTQYPMSGTCKNNWVCVGNECADLCLKTHCPPYYDCNPKNGVCNPEKRNYI